MPRPSSIKRLPREVQDRIAQLRQDGRTIDEIMQKLAELGADVSRSALGRYLQKAEQVSVHLERSRQIAELLVRRLGSEPSNKVAQMNLEMMHSVISRIIMQSTNEEDQDGMDAKEAMLISVALEKIAKAARFDQDRELLLRKQIEAETRAKTEEALKEVSKNAGISSDLVETIKAKIFGVETA
jgi:hypothetical protein